ncbi:MAG: hypothetical protein R6V85_11810 [Polyangia bacterium]
MKVRGRQQRDYGRRLALNTAAIVAVLAAASFLGLYLLGERSPLPPPADDPLGMAERCPWYDSEKLSLQWTVYLVTGDGTLIYVGFAGRLFGPDGEPFSGVNLVVIRDGVRRIDRWVRFPPERFELEARDLVARLDRNRIVKREREGRTIYDLQVRIPPGEDGERISVDAELKRRVGDCDPDGTALISRRENGNYFEYAVPVLDAGLSGTLEIGGERTRLEGRGYLESIRWLRSPMERPARWYWGYLHAGDLSLLVFHPDYPGARDLVLIAGGGRCAEVVADAGIEVQPPRPDEMRAVLTGVDPGPEFRLEVDARARRELGFPIFLAPYELEIERSGRKRTHDGTMVFELGEWRSF